MSTTSPLPPLDDLDLAFTLPENIRDANLRKLYEILVVRMRRESAHLPMNTVQQLLIERIAYNYIVMRYKESFDPGQDGAFQHATQQKEYNTFWLSMTQEFNKQMRSTDAEYRTQVFKAMAETVASILEEINDPAVRSRMKAKIADSLSKAGL